MTREQRVIRAPRFFRRSTRSEMSFNNIHLIGHFNLYQGFVGASDIRVTTLYRNADIHDIGTCNVKGFPLT